MQGDTCLGEQVPSDKEPYIQMETSGQEAFCLIFLWSLVR